MEISFSGEIDLVATYAAVLSTLIAIWEFIKWKNRNAIKLACNPNMLFIPFSDKKKYVIAKVINQGSTPTTVTHFLGYYWPSRFHKIFRKDRQAFIVNCTTVYTDVSGKKLVTVKRTDGADGKKTFLPYDHIAGKHSMPEIRPLYNLPGIAASDRIMIAEGEKCAQVLIDLGIPATTVMGGANFDPAKTDFSPLAGKDITIWPDNDKAGKGYVERLKTGLQSIKPRSLRVIIPPADKPEKWDAADAVQDGLNIQGFLNSVPQSKIQLQRYEAFSLAELIADKSPMPDDLIAPRLLTPSGMLVIGGAPKSGKSDFTLSLLTHMAAGQPFLKFTPPRPLRVFVLQAEIQYDYLRERLQKMGLSEEAILKAGQNIHITPQLKLLLNDDGLEIIKDLIHEKFPDAPPDIIVIDPIRNVFDGGPDFGNLGENDNNAMLFFLQQRVEMLRDMINPRAGITCFR